MRKNKLFAINISLKKGHTSEEKEKDKKDKQGIEHGTYWFNVSQKINSLVLDLKIKMSTPPVIEERLFYIAGGLELRGHPVMTLIIIDLHWQMTHLSGPDEPMAFKKSRSHIIWL